MLDFQSVWIRLLLRGGMQWIEQNVET